MCPFDLRHKIVVEDIARLELVVDEEVLAVVIGTGIQIAGECGDPAILRRRAERLLIIRMGITDKDIVALPRPARHATLPGRSLGWQTYHLWWPDGKW